jgi:hypothetical protein
METKESLKDWYVDEFESLSFNDERLKKRFFKICSRFDQTPGSIIRQSMETAQECKGAYRFWDNSKVFAQQFLNSHKKSISSRVKPMDVIFEIQDSSELDYASHIKKEGKGSTGRGVQNGGFQTHTCLLVTQTGLPLGIGSFRLWARPTKRTIKGGAVAKLPLDSKESMKWINGLRDTESIDLKGSERILLADREADFYEFLKLLVVEKKKFVIRLKWDRKIADRSLTIREQIELQEFLGYLNVELDAKGGSFGRAGKLLKLGIRFHHDNLQFEDKAGHKDYLPLTVVQAKEMPSYEGCEEWMLITNLPVDDIESAKKIVEYYGFRWQVEDFFKLLKGAMKIEEVRLETKEKVEKLVTFLSILCYRLFWISRISREESELPASLFFSDIELQVVQKKVKIDKKISEMTTKDAVIGIAKMGGYWGRKSDPPPGVMVIWRGWKRLQDIANFIEEAS